MAQRRMFSLEVVDTDAFLELPATSQALYFHLGMRADDDGFVSAPKKIAKIANCGTDDLNILAAKGFIIPLASGIVVIRAWKVNNYIQNDRYHETRYLDEKSLLTVDDAGFYELDTGCIHDVSNLDTQVRLGKVRLGERVADKPPARPRLVPPSVDEVKEYCHSRNNGVDPQKWYDHYLSNGWMVGKNRMKDWKAAVRTWETNGFDRGGGESGKEELAQANRNDGFEIVTDENGVKRWQTRKI